MVVDRGGLLYGVEVTDRFSGPLQRFQDEINRSRAAFRAFRRDAQLASETSTAAQTRARREGARAAADEARAERERLRALNAQAAQERKFFSERQRLRRSLEADAVRQRKAEAAAAAQQARAQAARTTQIVGATRGQIEFNRELGKTESAASRIAFTFRRLVGILAIFTLAREATAGFAGLVRGGFEFNQQLEQSRLGIAGILTAVSELRDEQGRLLEGAQAFNAAQGIARQQQELLRRDALQTTATYQELLDVFQVALGPGIAAGLGVDQIRQLSVLISQAASNIGLQQNQLSEEIRSLLTGNIRTTTSRIAQVLNLTNEDIRRFQSQGILFQELRDRLQGFALGAAAAAQTVGGLFQRLRDVVQLVSGRSAAESFEALRGTLQGLFDTLTVRRVTPIGELLEPNPKAQEAFDAIFNAINRILAVGRQLASSIGLDGATQAAQLFATALEVAGTAAVALVAGVVRGAATLQTIFGTIVEFFRGLGELLPAGASAELLTTLVQVATVVIGIQLAFRGVFGIVGRVVGAVAGLPTRLGLALLRVNNIVEATRIWVKETRIGAALLNTVRSRAFLIAGAFSAVVAGISLVAGSILDIDLQLQDLPEVFGTLFEQVFTKIISFGDVVFTTIRVRGQQAFNHVAAAAKTGIEKLKELFDLELGASDDLSRLAQREREDAREQRRRKLLQDNKALELEIIEAKERASQTDEDADRRAGERIQALRDQIALREKEAAAVRAQVDAENRRGGATVSSRPQPVTEENVQALAEAQRRVEFLQVEQDLRRRTLQLEELRGTAGARELETIRAQIVALREKAIVQQRASQDAITAFERENLAALSGSEGSERQANAQARLNALKREQRLEEDGITLEIAEQLRLQREAELIRSGTFTEGFGRGLENFAEQFGSAFQAGIDVASGLLQQFAQTVSQTITDALDPSQDVNPLERLAQFLKSAAQQIIQQFILIGLARLFASGGAGPATPFVAAGQSALGGAGVLFGHDGGEIPGFHGGGRIPRRSRRPASLRHYSRPKGLHRGGPPPGVHPKDTVPIWAEPGEFMQPLASVRAYGADFMEALRRRLIDPFEARGLMGARRLTHSIRPGRRGYQTGGPIGSAAREAAASVPAGSGQRGGQPSPAYIVPSDQAAERFLHGGRKGFLDFARANRADIASALGLS